MKLSILCRSLLLAVALSSVVIASDTTQLGKGSQNRERMRQPVALAYSPESEVLLVGNRKTGSVSVVDTSSGDIVQELSCGKSLTDVCFLDAERVLVLDAGKHQLLEFAFNKKQFTKKLRTIEVPAYPEQLAVVPALNQVWLTSRWSRRVTCFDDSLDSAPVFSIELSYEPSLLTQYSVRDDVYVVVADAFGGNLSVIDPETGKLNHQLLPMHNIRGLTQHGEDLIVAGQELNPLAQSTFDDVHWGNMISNHLFVIPANKLLDFSKPLAGRIRQVMLGGPDRAAGDPACVASLPNGKLAAAIGGTSEIFLFESQNWSSPKRVSVGSRPSDLASDGERLFVSNQFADSVSMLDSEFAEVQTEISLVESQEDVELSLEERGEKLFFDSRLSLEGWMSCHSCHTDGHAIPALNDNLSDGTFGAPKRVLSLFNVAETGPWAWDGKTASLKDQVIRSVESTMQGKALATEDVEALVAYLKSIRPPIMGRTDAVTKNEQVRVTHGKGVFSSHGCANCHKPETFTANGRFHVGLEDERGLREFNPPSLLAVSTRRSFLHDGRAHSLEQLFLKYGHPGTEESQLDALEVRALVAYLKTL